MKKEYQRKALIYTQGEGVQPAYHVHLYCPSESIDLFMGDKAYAQCLQNVKRATTTIITSTMAYGLIIQVYQSISRLENTSMLRAEWYILGAQICSLAGTY